MTQAEKTARPADIFMDIEAHIESGRFIRGSSKNRQDVRDFTFSDIDLSGCKDILDLGCSYGFFIKGLTGRLHSDALINGVDLWKGCEKHYIDACREAGYIGEFCLSDNAFCTRYPDESFDLVLCSYALYFFPDAIPEIARILRPNGIFITITHFVPHMTELIHMIKDVLRLNTGCQFPELPLEKLMNAFSSSNGSRLLSPWFRQVTEKKYVNSLTIDSTSLPGLIQYLCFKKPLFFPQECRIDNMFIETTVADYCRNILAGQNFFTVTKNDMVYVCQSPNC